MGNDGEHFEREPHGDHQIDGIASAHESADIQHLEMLGKNSPLLAGVAEELVVMEPVMRQVFRDRSEGYISLLNEAGFTIPSDVDLGHEYTVDALAAEYRQTRDPQLQGVTLLRLLQDSALHDEAAHSREDARRSHREIVVRIAWVFGHKRGQQVSSELLAAFQLFESLFEISDDSERPEKSSPAYYAYAQRTIDSIIQDEASNTINRQARRRLERAHEDLLETYGPHPSPLLISPTQLFIQGHAVSVAEIDDPDQREAAVLERAQEVAALDPRDIPVEVIADMIRMQAQWQ